MSIKILLADDSITIQKVIGIIFGGEEYALSIVDNGKAAIEKAQEVSPDVLLIDAIMPGMSGYDVCEAIRAIPALATKPILLLTGSFEPFDEAKANSCGADDFLAKPFESQQIVNKVKNLYELGLSRAVVPPAAPEPAPVPLETPVIAPTAAAPTMPETAEDIWAAFTMESEPAPPVQPVADVPAPAPEAVPAPELDVFAIVNEEPEVQLAPPETAPQPQSFDTGSQWIPVEEQTFEFTEEAIAEPPAEVLSAPAAPAPALNEASFGDISFEEVAIPEEKEVSSATVEPAQIDFGATMAEPEPAAAFTEPAAAFTEPAAAFAEPAATFTEEAMPAFSAETTTDDFSIPADTVGEPVTDNIPQAVETAAPIALTEEQLRAAIAAVSQDVIQKIVWEVVPDLAEAMIKEAIRKIKEGM